MEDEIHFYNMNQKEKIGKNCLNYKFWREMYKMEKDSQEQYLLSI